MTKPTAAERGKVIWDATMETMTSFGSPRPIPSVDWYAEQILAAESAAVEARDRQWHRAMKLMDKFYEPIDPTDPKFHGWVMQYLTRVVDAEERRVREDERERCRKVMYVVTTPPPASDDQSEEAGDD